MTKHARFSPSASKRYLSCPPALTLEEQFPDSVSEYAKEGTAGHALAEHLIKKHLKIRSKRPTSDYYTDELIEAVESYVDFVKEQIDIAKTTEPNPFLKVEEKADISSYVQDCFGTADMVIIANNTLQIIDLKLGKGVPVSAEHNTQLMMYALGIANTYDFLYDFDKARLTIYQPRLQNVSEWEISIDELKLWGEEVLKPLAKLALEGKGEYCVGEHCRFCRAKNLCRKRAENMLALSKFEFKDAPLLTDAEVTEVLKIADELKKWAEDVYTYAQDKAIKENKEWTGYKLVRGRSNRKYSDENAVIKVAEENGYIDIFKKTIIGITDMEKLMGKDNFNKILGNLIIKPQGKLTLVPITDKREAVKRDTADDDFETIEE